MKRVDIYRRFISSFIATFLPFLLFATQYDYYEDEAVAGGADRALNGIIIIIGIIVLIIIIIALIGGFSKIYYWFNPQESPEYKAAIKKKEQDAQRAKERLIQEQKQAIIQTEKKKEKKAIDLGLSVLWSDINLYADTISNMGAKYSWGDIQKRTYFRYIDAKLNKKSRYEMKRIFGNEDLSICGNMKYDAARNLWGSNWRLPLNFEIEELINQCQWEWTSIDGTMGYKVTGKNGNSIFLPVTSEIIVDKCNSPEAGFYWSGIANDDVLGEEAHFLFFDANQKIQKNNGIRWHGMAIRPVWSSQNEIIEKDGFTMSLFGTKLIKCNDISTCHIPYGVKIIAKEAFKDAKNINRLYIPNSVEEIEDLAFSRLNIQTVYIPKSITKIGSCVFQYCKNLKYIEIEDGLTVLGVSMFDGCENLEEINIPDSIKYLPNGIFNFCKSLKHVKLSSNLTSIGNLAFYMCDSLESIELPASLIGIQDNTFTFCIYLSSVTIPEGVVAISSNAFTGCIGLSKVRIPATLQHLDVSAFDSCDDITLEVPKGTSSYYKKMNLEGVGEIIEYDAITPNNIDELKTKSDNFVRLQNYKREREDYEYRRQMGQLTREEYDIENIMFNDIMDNDDFF